MCVQISMRNQGVKFCREDIGSGLPGKRSGYFYLCVLWLLFLSSCLQASPTVKLVEGIDRYPLGLFLEVLQDPTGAMSYEEATSLGNGPDYLLSMSSAPNYGFTGSALWVNVEIANIDHHAKQWLLELAYPGMEEIELYIRTGDGRVSSLQSGKIVPFKNRPVAHHNYVFELSVPSGNNISVLMRFKTDRSMQIPLTLWEPRNFWEKSINEIWGLGLYFGIMLALALYNLFIYFSTKDNVYLYYIFYIGSFGLLMMELDGLSTQYFWQESPWWEKHSISALLTSTFYFIIQFTQSFLSTEKNSPRLHSILSTVKWANLAMCISIVYPSILPIQIYLAIFSSALVLVSGVTRWVSGYRAARFFMLAWVTLMIGAIILGLQRQGLLPINAITEYGVLIGSAFEVILLSLSLADRIKMLQLGHEKTQEELLTLKTKIAIDLEEKVKQRTNEISNANIELGQEMKFHKKTMQSLREAKQMADQASQSKTDFLSRISHELRTPLNAIIGFSQIQKSYMDKSMPPKMEVTRNHILNAGMHLRDLIDEILDLVDIDKNNIAVHLEHANLNPIIEQSLALVHADAGKQQVSLIYESTDLAVETSPQRLRQIMVNLLSNAIKYNRQDGSVIVRVNSKVEGGIEITVEDTGVGIDPADYERIFEPFTRLTHAIDQNIPGAGIGLSLTKTLTEKLGGVIKVEKIDAGSRFSLSLPKSNTIHNTPEAKSKTLMQSSGPTQTVLYIEDNGASRDLFQLLLEPFSEVTLLLGGTAEEGIKIAKERLPDLIFMDINLPGISGIEATRILKQDAALQHTRIIALSADAMPQQIEVAMAAGFDHYLTKPIDLDLILSEIKNNSKVS